MSKLVDLRINVFYWVDTTFIPYLSDRVNFVDKLTKFLMSKDVKIQKKYVSLQANIMVTYFTINGTGKNQTGQFFSQ